MSRKRIDLTGVRFGRLTAIKRAEDYISSNGKHQSQWLCKCDCGNENIVVAANSLRRGLTKSCGCLSKETLSKRRKKSEYVLSGEYGIGYTINNEEFYFDLEDYDLIKDYNWCIDAGGYVCTNVQNDNIRTHIKLHRLVMKCDDSKLDIDHINHIKNDNRKSNLRIVTRCQNNMNMRKRSDNTSGVTGVIWYKTKNKWRAEIIVNKKHISLGYYKNFEDAVKVRKEAEEKYFGEYSYDNSVISN
jgi:hypothetical protein